MATNWVVFPTGFGLTLKHDNKPTEEEMKQAFIKKIGAFLQGEHEFAFEANDPIKLKEDEHGNNN